MKKLFTLLFVLTFSSFALFAQKPLEANNILENFEGDGSSTVTEWFLQDPDMNALATIADPADAANTVGDYNRTGSFEYTNAQFILVHRMDLSARNVFSLKVYFPSANDYTGNLAATAAIKLQNSLLGGNAWSTQHEVKLDITDFDQWVTLDFDFSAVYTRDDFDQIVIQFGGEGHTVAGQFYFDDLVLKADEAAVTHIDFDTKNEDIVFESWNQSSTFAKVANPDSDGINTSAFVGQFTSGNDNEIGVGIKDATDVFVTPFDFSDITYFKMKVWSDHEADVTFHLENMPNWGNNVEVSSSITSTQLNQWVELTFDFTGVTKDLMNNIVIKVGGSNTTEGSVIYFDDIKGPALSTAPVLLAPSLPIDFEEGAVYDYTWSGFGAADWGAIHVAVVANPDASGINVSETVVEINKGPGAQTWAGASLNLAGAVDFTNGTIINIKAYSPRADVPVLLKMEDSNSAPDGNGNPSVFVEVLATVTSSDTWETLEFDISTATGFDAANSYDRVIIFPDFNAVGADELFYFDDIKFKEDATGFEELDAVIFNVYPNPASDYLFISNISNLKRIDIYSVTGQKIKTIEAIENRIQISELPQGVYVISAENNSGEVFSTKFFKK